MDQEQNDLLLEREQLKDVETSVKETIKLKSESPPNSMLREGNASHRIKSSQSMSPDSRISGLAMHSTPEGRFDIPVGSGHLSRTPSPTREEGEDPLMAYGGSSVRRLVEKKVTS